MPSGPAVTQIRRIRAGSPSCAESSYFLATQKPHEASALVPDIWHLGCTALDLHASSAILVRCLFPANHFGLEDSVWIAAQSCRCWLLPLLGWMEVLVPCCAVPHSMLRRSGARWRVCFLGLSSSGSLNSLQSRNPCTKMLGINLRGPKHHRYCSSVQGSLNTSVVVYRRQT